MPSDAGGASARRRRDLSPLINLLLLCLSFLFLISFFVYSNLSKYPYAPFHVVFFPEGSLCDGRVYQCSIGSDLKQISDASLSSNPKPEASQQSSGSSPQTSEQGFIDITIVSRSGLAPTPLMAPFHRISLMAGVSLGPSDVSFPVGTSTAHDELKRWQVISLYASPPTITLIFHNGGDCVFLLLTTSTLGFVWMGLIFCCGPITPLWPISRSDLSITLQSLSLKSCFSQKDGRGLHSILGTMPLEEICLFNYRNLMDSAVYLSPDATLIFKLSGSVFFSNLRCCDATQASALICEYILSMDNPTSKPSHGVPRLMGKASQPSRTFWIKPPRKLYPSSAAFSAFWTCDILWRIQQTYSSKEIPSPEPYFGIGKKSPPAASSMEHFYKSSYASIVRAYYDHKLIRDFAKLVFKFESLQVPKDLPVFAIFLKLCILENSWNLYPYLSCNALSFSCMNSPLMRI
ncbi:unnamed protein product [Arabidopsis arenosa]|uniref:Uncharacterized protein n=1 Tax=Arabidopsis arenosa TaxID=38785 RepID=A0A8S1ZPZ0_ARAAE|nr:unnamed protein product [Arabidopsis arenosa]